MKVYKVAIFLIIFLIFLIKNKKKRRYCLEAIEENMLKIWEEKMKNKIQNNCGSRVVLKINKKSWKLE